jgi:hypothetical protein
MRFVSATRSCDRRGCWQRPGKIGRQIGRYRLGPGQIPEDDLGAEPLQLSRTLVLATDHETHRHILSTQLLEDRTAHAPGTRD